MILNNVEEEYTFDEDEFFGLKLDKEDEANDTKKNNNSCDYKQIRSYYILEIILGLLNKGRILDLMKYNKNLKNKYNESDIFTKEDYLKYCSPIKIKIIPHKKSKEGKFINISEKDKKYFHIFFNGINKEINNIYLNNNHNVNSIIVFIDKEISSFKGLFESCRVIKSLEFIDFERINITDMSKMFKFCFDLKHLNFNKFNSSNTTDMSNMFNSCHNLTKLDLSNFDTKKVINMSGMFKDCTSLIELNLSNINTDKVTNMSGMFENCTSLIELDLSNISTDKVINMKDMFSRCLSLKEINLSKFNTKNVEDISGMFYECKNLENIDISHFNIDRLRSVYSLFCACSNLKKVKTPNFYSILFLPGLEDIYKGTRKTLEIIRK